jgi:hypothetical protein
MAKQKCLNDIFPSEVALGSLLGGWISLLYQMSAIVVLEISVDSYYDPGFLAKSLRVLLFDLLNLSDYMDFAK